MEKGLIKSDILPSTLEEYSNNLKTKLDFCELILKSGMVPFAYKTPQQVLVAVLYGQELGFSPMQSLQTINVIQGVPSLSANGIKAKILQAGGKFETVFWDDKICTLRCHRDDWAEEFSYSEDDARKAGLLEKDNWKKQRKAMLYARAVSMAGRNMYADILKNFYGTEEMQDAVNVTPVVNQRPPVVLDEEHCYEIRDITKAQQEYLEKEGAEFDQDRAVWVSNKKLHPNLDKYLKTDFAEGLSKWHEEINAPIDTLTPLDRIKKRAADMVSNSKGRLEVENIKEKE